MNKKSPGKQFVLGVGIDDVKLDQVVEIVKQWLIGKGKHYIVTPNPEFIMAAQDDLEFKEILNKADLAIPDGVGLKLSGKIKNTVAGVDLMEKLCELSAEKARPSSPDGEAYGGRGFTTGFLGGKKGVVKKAAECLQKKYPGLKVAFAEEGGEIDDDGQWKIENRVLKMENGRWNNLSSNINPQKSIVYPLSSTVNSCDILFVGFGQVKQEKWIAKNLGKLPVKVAMGVGGAFDYLSGNVKRAPRWIRKLGLEWLFRLVYQPWRIKRQFRLLRFVLLVKK